ncbi:type I restriction-modification system subunit M [Peptoniphilus harei]|uniref:type I restriction-modification system subunit M n=1 Tax=Peptoniphilus harei TaxID=54005 RepID=UPI0029159B9F|nr:type I restriction-modification system subunit M [Peptoniphilus harei]MDU6097733.1 type I restriction-modification system subunit M [Peptoniphilus harei]
MDKQQLASTIWESANQMRSKIEASEYKDFILGFIFYKYLSDKELRFIKNQGLPQEDIEKISEDDEEYAEFVRKNLGYFISYENLYSTWLSKGGDFEIADVRDALSAFDRNIDSSYKKVFENIFKTLSSGLSKLGESAAKQTKAARSLLNLIKRIPMDGSQDYDVLGFVYEYLISMFAANAGKKAGEFYTPHEVSVLMSEIIAEELKDRDKIKIYDSTSGSGSLLINIGKAMRRYLDSDNKIDYYAQELKENTYNLTRMNLVMRDIKPANINVRNGDTLEDDWPFFEDDRKDSTYNLVKADAVVSNPPYSQKWSPKNKEHDPRYKYYGTAPRGKADYAFLLHDLYHLELDGIMTIVLPHGVLFRGNAEGEIRKNLIEKNKIDTIIGLPANVFFGTSIPTIIMILRHNKESNDVLIIDASKGFEKSGKSNKLRDCDIRKITDTIRDRISIEKYSRVVTKDEIRKNEYNLNIPRYVDSSEPVEKYDLYASMFGGIPKSEIMELSDYWEELKGLDDEIFRTKDGDYFDLNIEELNHIIQGHKSSDEYIKKYKEAFDGFKENLKEDLIDGMLDVEIAEEREKIVKNIFERLETIKLVDKYKAYQIFANNWNTIETDLEMILDEGFDIINLVDPNMVVKKKKEGEEEVPEVQEGWRGRILPFELVQENLLKDELEEIRNIEARLAEITSEYEEILNSLEEDEKDADYVKEDNSSFVNAEVKKYMKEACDEIETDEIKILNGYLELSKKAEKEQYVNENNNIYWDLMEKGKSGTYTKTEINKRIAQIQQTFSFEEDSLESKLQKVTFLIEEETTLKSDLKIKREELHLKTKDLIESLDEDKSLDLLYKKWIAPLVIGLDELGKNVLINLEENIRAIYKKYAKTFVEIEKDLNETQEEFISMSDKLMGNEKDLAGIKELQKLLEV